MIKNKISWKIALIAYFIVLVPVVWFAAVWTHENKSDELSFELMKLEKSLHHTLQNYQSVPKILQKSEAVLSVLRAPTDSSIDLANRELYEVNSTLKGDVSYLMATDGVTIASSNYKGEDSFVGKNFSFRPYFKIANSGVESSYSALGAISGKRGYYFSSPVLDKNKVIGVVVIKVSLAFIEDMWRESGTDFVISDSDGVIFFSSRLNWLYRTMHQLPQKRIETISASLRYRGAELQSISEYTSPDELFKPTVILSNNGEQKSWIIKSSYMPDWEWRMYSLTPTSTILPELAFFISIYTLIMLLLLVLYLYFGKRIELQIHLEEMNTQLEFRVSQLTGEQMRTNAELQNLVDHYHQAQTELQDTQTQLIQTAKLAVLGEFSASLHHELSQPLQALQSYSSNCKKMLAMDKLDGLQQNLEEISVICHAMGGIIAKFKIFARRTNPDPRPASLKEIISATWTIVRPKFKNMDVVFDNKTIDAEIFCEPVLVQQVLVNLLNNALQALEGTCSPRIRMTSWVESDYLNLCVDDNGPKVTVEQMSHFFEPFFTTKESGLGLGLTISRRIMESQNGEINVMTGEDGGVAFNIKLSLYKKRGRYESDIIG
jgi:two-component system C4-dicarboxylate transport sensor histidine kinase DctB